MIEGNELENLAAHVASITSSLLGQCIFRSSRTLNPVHAAQ